MKRISFKGVLIGSITDIVSTNILMIILFVYVMIARHLQYVPKDQTFAVFLQLLKNDSALHFTQIFIGAFCSMLGGYIAAKISKRHEILNGVLAAFLCVGSGVYALLHASSSLTVWNQTLEIIATLVISGFGGFVRLRVVQRQALRNV